MRHPLWSGFEASAATGGTTSRDWRAFGLSIDTRELNAGDLFIALKDKRDGHDFVGDALEKGAVAALVSRAPDGVAPDQLLLLGDVQKGLEDLARTARARMSGQVIAVTGSVGKTSTKEMLRKVFSEFGKTSAAARSFNNHWGVPLSLARVPSDADWAVLEIGMSGEGEIAPLSTLAAPDLAIVTHVAPVHLAGFANEAGIADEKAQIFKGLKSDGFAICNGDMGWHERIMAHVAPKKTYLFGRDPAHDFAALDIHEGADGSRSSLSILGTRLTLRLRQPGAHHVMNALAVLGAAALMGCDPKRAAEALWDWESPKGRGNQRLLTIDGKKITLLDESYNANPTSMRAALSVLVASKAAPRRVAILGDMRELGAQEIDFHRALADLPSFDAVELVITIGQNMQALAQALEIKSEVISFESADAALKDLTSLLASGDVVMIKGSNSSGLSKLVSELESRAGEMND